MITLGWECHGSRFESIGKVLIPEIGTSIATAIGTTIGTDDETTAIDATIGTDNCTTMLTNFFSK